MFYLAAVSYAHLHFMQAANINVLSTHCVAVCLLVLQLAAPFTSLSGDPAEVSDALWLSPVEALDMARRKQLVLPPPTTYILHELEHIRTLEELFAQ